MLGTVTQRLRLIPLNAEDYRLYIDNPNQLEENLGLMITNTMHEAPMKGAHEARLRRLMENQREYPWLTNWIMVLQKENRIIGGVMIKGTPNSDGEVIIGYGTDGAYQKNGYMAEAIDAMTKWILKDPKALSVIADTDKNNVASHKVLQKNGFFKYRETSQTDENGEVEELVWWRLDRQ